MNETSILKVGIQKLSTAAFIVVGVMVYAWSLLDLRQRHSNQRFVIFNARRTDDVIGNSFSRPTTLYNLYRFIKLFLQADQLPTLARITKSYLCKKTEKYWFEIGLKTLCNSKEK